MAICKCSPKCEHYVSAASITGLHPNCAARVRRWEGADVGHALEYARKLEVRRGTLSFVVSNTQVAEAAVKKRIETSEKERKERAEKARPRKKRKGKGRVDSRAKG